VIEVEFGTPLREVLEGCGGARAGRAIRAVISGVANPVLTADQLDTPVSYEGMEAAGSGLGAAGFVVYDDTACMVEVARVLSRFLYVESCGQCLPCKIGTGEITGALVALSSGTGDRSDLDRIQKWLPLASDANRCYLPVEERRVIASLLAAFAEDFLAHLEGPCPRPREIPVPKIVNLEAGKVTYDARQAKKRSDWTYEE
jgi:NADH-quinone oxidoreductase subunit F